MKTGLLCRWVALRALGVLLLAGACGGPPALPPAGPTPLPPPPPRNAAPEISLIFLSTTRVEARGRIGLAAVVQDAETPVDELTYEWTSDKATGQFIGAGRTVQWEAPALQPSPDVHALTVTVTERYQEHAEEKFHRVSASVSVHYNDSGQEIRDLALRFLQDFSTYSVSPEACVRSFSDRCPGKFDELDDIKANRRNYRIQSGTFSVRSVTIDATRLNGTVVLPCEFVSTIVIPTRPGQTIGGTERVSGTCSISVIYEPSDWRWYLCQSRFTGTTAAGFAPSRDMVP